ncbi:MAG: hypothetical protein EA379_08280 [Phycisphaerales bacterium]|nr:MAG: hypothetical protein EA379_08280 [Phycisphaerales bacterium]
MSADCRLTTVTPIDYGRSRLGPLEPLLTSRFKGAKVYLEPDRGNNGDILIMCGTRHMFSVLGFQQVDSPEQADVLFLKGGGAMTEQWRIGFQTIKSYSAQFPDKPLVVLPSSYRFKETNFPALFEGRRAPAFLFTREMYSYELLEPLTFPTEVEIGYDHDQAFQLEGSDYIRDLKKLDGGRYILIVERHDGGEKAKPERRNNSLPYRVGRAIVPIGARNAMRRRRHYPKDLPAAPNTAFAQESMRVLRKIAPGCDALPVRAQDISVPGYVAFENFGKLIAGAGPVASQRLHVSCLAFTLGKPIVMDPGFYYKIRGVYELSMRTRDDVVLHDFAKAEAPPVNA